jgi:hypothetical protein
MDTTLAGFSLVGNWPWWNDRLKTWGVTILIIMDLKTEGGISSCPGDLFSDNDLTIGLLMISVSLVGLMDKTTHGRSLFVNG